MAKKEIHHIEIEPAENGGHTVTHHFHPIRTEGRFGIQEHYMEPERHVFGEDEGHEMLAHIANHLAIPEVAEGEPVDDEGERDTRKGPREEKGDTDEPGTGRKGPKEYKGDQDEDESKGAEQRKDRGRGEGKQGRMTKEKAKRVREAVRG